MSANLQFEIEKTLRGSPILSSFTDEALRDLLAKGEIVKFQLGDTIATSEHVCDGLYVLLNGRVRRYLAGEGGRPVTLEILSKPGQFFGVECWQGEDVWRLGARASAESTLFRLKSDVVSSLAKKGQEFKEQIQRQHRLMQELCRHDPSPDNEHENISLPLSEVYQHSEALLQPPQPVPVEASAAGDEQDIPSHEPLIAKLRRGLRRYPFVSQQSSMDCGITCLAMIAMFYGRPASLRYLSQLAEVSRYGTSLLSLVEAADKIGFTARGFKASYEGLMRMQLPAILYWKKNHFVVLYEINASHAVVGDPAEDLIKVPRDRFNRHYSGIALEVALTQRFGQSFKGKKAFPLLLTFLAPFRSLIRDILVISLIYQMLMILTPLFTQVIVDKVIVHQNVSMLNMMLLGMVVFTFFESLMSFLRSILLAFFAMKADKAIYSQFFRHLLTLPLGFFESKTIGDVLARLNENQKIREFLSGSGATVILDSGVICVYFFFIFSYNLVYGLAALTYILMMICVMIVYTPILRNLSRLNFDKQVTCDSFVVESIRGMETIKSAAAETPICCKWEEYFTQSLNVRFKEMLARDGAQVLSRILHMGGYVALLYLGANLVIKEELTIGQLMALNMMVEMVSQPVMRMIEMWDGLQNVNTALERVADVLEAEPEQPEPSKTITLTEVHGAVKFDSVTFRYSGMDERNTLLNVSFEARPGQLVALVGRSGSGKSTLLKLVQGLYMPVGGRVYIDDHDITQVSLSHLRRQIGVVSQQDYFFQGTIREAISTHRPGAPLDEIAEVARQVGLHEFIVSLPAGYETHISEAAHNLSGGQRQRLALARALLHGPRILLLDEPTSALDPESERHIQESLLLVGKERSVFIAAHRLSTVRDADMILVMDRGQIVETGNHDSLMRERGLYYFLCKEQLGR